MRTAAVILAFLWIGCGPTEAPSVKPTWVTTIDPFRAVLEPVAGLRGRVERLLPSGASPHTYEPRPSDMRKVASADGFFYGAKQLDGWAARLDGSRPVEMIQWLPDSLLLTMHDHGHGSIDPHFWLDPLLVRSILPRLVDSLCELDDAGCSEYRQNAGNFADRLGSLHDSLRVMLEPVRGSAFLLSHPFLGYFARRYGLRVAGVIEEIPGSEPTPQDMRRMVQEARRSGAGAIFTQPQLPVRAANSVAEVVGLRVVELDPLSAGQARAFSYEDLLYYNAEKIRSALASPPAKNP